MLRGKQRKREEEQDRRRKRGEERDMERERVVSEV